MRTNIVIDDALMAEALKAAGARTKREAVEMGLRALVRLSRQAEERKRVAARRLANIGYAREAAEGFDLSVEALKQDRDADRRERKARGADL